MEVFIVLLLCCGLWTYCVDSQTYENAVQLKTALLTSYDPGLVPKNNQSEALNVSFSLNIYSILAINIIDGTIDSVMSLTTTWKDERLVWNASDYGGLTQIRFAQDVVWSPVMGMTKAVKIEEIGDKYIQVTYQNDGTAVWTPASEFKFSCTFNVRYWPFDKQICYAAFFLFNESPSEVQFSTSESGAGLTYYNPNSEWSLEDTFAKNIVYPGLSEIVYGLKLKRYSLFHGLTIIVPLVCLNLLMCLVFLLPSESGDRIGYIVTLMLAIVVFLILIGDHVPKTSDPLPLIAGYLITIVIFAILCLLATVLGLSVFFRQYDVPGDSWGRKLVRVVGLPCCRKQSCDKDASQDNDRVSRFSNKVDIQDGKDLRQIKNLEPVASEDNVTWKDVCYALDKILFLFFLVGTVLPSVVIPAYIAASSEYPEA